jgi:hypothetical protein
VPTGSAESSEPARLSTTPVLISTLNETSTVSARIVVPSRVRLAPAETADVQVRVEFRGESSKRLPNP